MLITVALCTHNHVDRLERTLCDLRRLRTPSYPWELLIVDNASSDRTPELLATGLWRPTGVPIRIVREERLGLSSARNRAIDEAAGEYVIFIDDDETPDANWLTAYDEVIRTARPDAMGGRIEVMFEGGARPAWLQDELLGFLGRLDHGLPTGRIDNPRTPIYGGNFGFRKQIFDRIGRFDTGLGRKGTVNTGGEDVDMYRRLIDAGCTVWWVPQALIHHQIQSAKLRRGYFLDLHYRQGRAEGTLRRGSASRMPPLYLFPQVARACGAAVSAIVTDGRKRSLRKEMNVAYFLGYLSGWVSR